MFRSTRFVVRLSTLESSKFSRLTTSILQNPLIESANSLSKNILVNSSFVRQLTLPSKMAKALLIVADGTEEMEAVITADVLRRGNVTTTIAGLNSADPVKCSKGLRLIPDTSLEEAVKSEYDAIVLPGGIEGAKAFCASTKVGELLKKQEAAGKYCAAICAAPTAIKQHGIGSGKSLTSYPGKAADFKGTSYKYIDNEPVVVDDKLVTSRGPGTTFAFGLKLVELLVDKKTSDEIKAAMLVKE